MGTRSVLIIEDDKKLSRSLSEIVKGAGYRPIVAVDGLMAIQKCAMQKFDLILCDIGLPRIQGDEVITLLKKSGSNMNTPIVVLSGNVNKNILLKIQGKVSKIFVKPFDSDELMAHIKKTVPL